MSDAQNNYFWVRASCEQLELQRLTHELQEGDVGNYTQGGAARVTARDQNFIV